MTWNFADSFDLYAANADAYQGYWDSGSANFSLTTGRFTSSQALLGSTNGVCLAKSSGANDAMHHLVVAYRQTAAISGTTLGLYLQLLDGTTGQCAVVFRSDGAILLTSATAGGTTLATYTGAFPVTSTWYAFEIEIIISNTVGRFRVRKNGNTSDDFDSGASLNTRPGTNSYANKLQVGQNASIAGAAFDDLFWRSDASSVAWMGDIRCYTRMPASDSSVQFARSITSNTQTPFGAATTGSITAGTARYTPITAAYSGTISTATVSLGTGYTGNLKCSIFASSGSGPTTVLGSANVVTNPVTGSNPLTFGTPVTVVKGTQYWIGFDSDTSSGTWTAGSGLFADTKSTTSYASFPVASPTTTSGVNPVLCSLTIAPTVNADMVSEAPQDDVTSYVYDSTVGHTDLYGIASIGSNTPSTILAVTTRGYMIKSDAGSRTAAVQLKSGGTTVASPTLTLTTSGWQWAWRTDTTDPNTGSAWTQTAVNNALIGPTVIS